MNSSTQSGSVVHRGRCGDPHGPVFVVGLVVIMAAIATPLAHAGEIHDAISAGDRARVGTLLRQDPSLARAPNENPTRDLPLHTAAYAGQVEIAQLLLDAGGEIEGVDSDGSTALHCAAVVRKPEMVRFLLSRGADVNRRDKNGAYSLSFAASGGDSACVRLILDAGADLNLCTPQGTTLLHYACSRGLWGLVDPILAAGGDINRGDGEGRTPLHLACQGRFPERVEQTIARGASVAAADSDGTTPLHYAAMFDRPDVARVLLARGADVNAADHRDSTPIIMASHGGAPMVQLLLEHGAKPDVQSEWGQTPILVAVDNGNAATVDLLLKAGADTKPTEADFGMTPLHLAALLGYRDVAENLLSRGVEVNARDREGRTPLDVALQYGQRGVAEALAAAGAQPAPDRDGASSAPLVLPRPGSDEAFVWSLGHSGWAVKTKNHVLVFDAGAMGRNSDQPSLQNGSINPMELAGEDVAVFVSHEHGDHYDPAIFTWKEQIPRIRYLMGFRPRPAPGQVQAQVQAQVQTPAQTQAQTQAPPQIQPTDYVYLPPGESKNIDGMKVTTIESNDSGVGFFVEVDGVTIFHAGDHANRYRDMSGPFKPQIDGLVARGVRPDLTFLPVTGCNFGDQVAVKIGVEYQLAQLQPKVFFPMHGGKYGVRLRDFVTELGTAFPATAKLAALSKGDSFHYRDGKVL
jgi:ankyrin repeat protein/L-ascorbate metabolism protein UlaG (beta-lactamase superfamily)